jgi:hypothetical protein
MRFTLVKTSWLVIAVVAGTICRHSSLALADGRAGSEPSQPRPTTRQNDPRLPPVIPGEEIVTETGQRMRVWSSSGPVPVMRQPTPQALPQGLGGAGVVGGGVGVIVDGRHPIGPPGGHNDGSRPTLGGSAGQAAGVGAGAIVGRP